MDEFTKKIGLGENYMVVVGFSVATALLLYRVLGLYFQSREDAKAKPPAVEEEREPPRNFTLAQLAEFTGGERDKNGKCSKPIYIAIKRIVYDVSRASDFYGPGSNYHVFAGHDATVNLAKMSFDEKDRNLMKWDDLAFTEREALDGWIETFSLYKGYPVVGKVVEPPEPREFTVEELQQYKGKGPVPEGAAAAPIYVGAGGKVFDVSYGGSAHYGEGCGYHLFAGRDASRALALMSFEEANLNNPKVDDLSDDQKAVLVDWVNRFEQKKLYPVVGTIAKSP